MSRSMLSPAAAFAMGVSSLPRTRTQQPGSPTLIAAQRMIAGCGFVASAWIDQATSASSAPSSLLSLCGLR
jgi:hypothetical protein